VDAGNRKKSLHDVLRERRAAKPLLSVRELQLRESERQRAEAEALAADLVERRRRERKPVDADGKLAPEVYRAVFARNRSAYYGSRHWSRRSRAQLALTPYCEVERCGCETGLRALHLDRGVLGAERAGDDLATVCERCERRVHKLAAELGRLPGRADLRRLDPDEPLFDPAAIAELKARYARPLRRSDLGR
jgi:hypothetical protein